MAKKSKKKEADVPTEATTDADASDSSDAKDQVQESAEVGDFKYVSIPAIPDNTQEEYVHLVVSDFDRFFTSETDGIAHASGNLIRMWGRRWLLAENGDAHRFLAPHIAKVYVSSGRAILASDHKEKKPSSIEERQGMRRSGGIIKV